MSTDLDVAIVGAGVSGLATARGLRAAGREVQVFEAADRVGGRMRTLRQDGYVIDEGAEAVATRGFPETWRLIRELGLRDADVPRVPGTIATWCGGRPRPGVGRARGLVTGLGLGPRGRAQLLRFTLSGIRQRRAFDPEHPESTPLGEESVARLAERYGSELAEGLLQPLITGFTGWYPDRSAAGPFLAHLFATRTTANWRTYRDGMDTLARRLADGLPLTTGAAVREVIVARHGAEARLTFASGARLTARQVVLAVPAPIARALHPGAPDDELPYLRASSYSVRLRVSFALRGPLGIAGAPGVYALILSAAHEPVVGAVTVDHLKNRHRVPPGAGLVSVLTGPDASRALIGSPDEEVVRQVADQAEAYVPGLRDATLFARVHRFPHGVPEATAEALRLRGGFLRRPPRRVDYAGDWLMQRPSSEGALRSASLVRARLLRDAGQTAPGVVHG